MEIKLVQKIRMSLLLDDPLSFLPIQK